MKSLEEATSFFRRTYISPSPSLFRHCHAVEKRNTCDIWRKIMSKVSATHDLFSSSFVIIGMFLLTHRSIEALISTSQLAVYWVFVSRNFLFFCLVFSYHARDATASSSIDERLSSSSFLLPTSWYNTHAVIFRTKVINIRKNEKYLLTPSFAKQNPLILLQDALSTKSIFKCQSLVQIFP